MDSDPVLVSDLKAILDQVVAAGRQPDRRFSAMPTVNLPRGRPGPGGNRRSPATPELQGGRRAFRPFIALLASLQERTRPPTGGQVGSRAGVAFPNPLDVGDELRVRVVLGPQFSPGRSVQRGP